MGTDLKSKKRKKAFWGYGIAGFGDSSFYTFLSSFLLFFLTSVAHVPTVFAGIISSAGGIGDAIWSPIIGYISDNSTWKRGRRRPLIILGAAICLVSLILMFVSIPGSVVIKVIYYGVLVLVFWLAFSTFFVPYLAFGAEVATEYDDRTLIRTLASFFNSAGTLVGTVLPTFIVTIMLGLSLSKNMSWFIAATVIAILAFLAIFIGWKMTAGSDTVKSKEDVNPLSLKDMVHEYLQVIKLKTLRYMVFGSIISLFAYTMLTSGRMYFLTYNMGYSEAKSTLIFLTASIMWMALTPLIKILSDRLEKRGAFMLGTSIAIVVSIFFGFFGMNSLPSLLIYLFAVSLGTCCYWQLFPAMIYDVSEVDEYVNGRRREGTIVSVQALAEALAGAFAVFMVSVILNLSGFDGTVHIQSQFSQNWILYINTFFPAAFFTLGVLCVYKFPLTKKRHELLKVALSKNVTASDNNSEYDELKKLL